ncbi:MAG: shikimate dehydrogenase [Endomicrobium sp.]|jgi:shikimate dehydrogenase|nr:shikimate dehydrogenase [Endomicrobium sp.]
MLNVNTKLFAILGCPIKQSRSPIMQNNWFKEAGLNCAYTAFSVEKKDLKKVFETLKLLGFCGFNITVPHKVEIMKLLDFIDPAPKAIGSVNTILIKNGKTYGYNTDYLGIEKDFADKKISVEGKTIFIYGAGGAAKSVLYFAQKNKAKSVYISNRTHSKAISLAKQFGAKAIELKDSSAYIAESDIIINASSCGLNKGDKLPFAINSVKKGAIAYDLIYADNTALCKLAKQKKIKFFNGEGMLINQGISAFEIWTGLKPSAASAKRILRKN